MHACFDDLNRCDDVEPVSQRHVNKMFRPPVKGMKHIRIEMDAQLLFGKFSIVVVLARI